MVMARYAKERMPAMLQINTATYPQLAEPAKIGLSVTDESAEATLGRDDRGQENPHKICWG